MDNFSAEETRPKSYSEVVANLRKIGAAIVNSGEAKPMPGLNVSGHDIWTGWVPEMPLPANTNTGIYTDLIRHELPSLRAARPRRGRMSQGKSILLQFSRRTPEAS